MKIKLAFYKAQPFKFVDWAIAGWTWLRNPTTPAVSHVEIGIPICGKYMWFSSTNRDGAKGTRWIEEDKLFKNPDRWIVMDLDPIRDISEMLETADAEVNKPYDWLGIAGFATITGLLNDKNRWYCSEICWYVLTGNWIKRISPRKMYAKCLNLSKNSSKSGELSLSNAPLAV